MTLTAWTIIGLSIVAGSFLSGVFGMAGGMVVIGVPLIYFDVATAMILFSIIQLAANGWRAAQWWSFVRWDIIWRYCLGGLVAFAVLRVIEFVPDKALVYLLLGLMPFAVEILPASWRPSIEWRGVPFVTGIFTTRVFPLSAASVSRATCSGATPGRDSAALDRAGPCRTRMLALGVCPPITGLGTGDTRTWPSLPTSSSASSRRPPSR